MNDAGVVKVIYVTTQNNKTIAFGELMCLSAQKAKVDCLDIALLFIIKPLVIYKRFYYYIGFIQQ
jgi:hypothetical protein